MTDLHYTVGHVHIPSAAWHKFCRTKRLCVARVVLASRKVHLSDCVMCLYLMQLAYAIEDEGKLQGADISALVGYNMTVLVLSRQTLWCCMADAVSDVSSAGAFVIGASELFQSWHVH